VLTPASADILFFRMEGARITPETAEEFRSMPEVEHVFPQLSAAFPVSADFQMESVGAGFTTDIILFGADFELVGDKAVPRIVEAARNADPPRVPVLISEYFLDAYNLGLAESSGMPKLSRSAIHGVEFDLLLGESTIGLGESAAAPRIVPAKIVGLTPNPLLFGVTMPIDGLREYNRIYAPEKKEAYAALHVDAVDPEGITAIREKAQEKKLGFSAQADVLERYLRVVGSIEGLLIGALAIVLALSAIGVFTTMAAVIRDQRPRWGLYRATGMRPMGVMGLAQGYALAAAIPAAIVATGFCAGVSAALSRFLGDSIAELSIFPGNPFALTAQTVAVIFIFALFFALLPACLYALPISRTRPVKLLSERSL
jgi:hypothetical protein